MTNLEETKLSPPEEGFKASYRSIPSQEQINAISAENVANLKIRIYTYVIENVCGIIITVLIIITVITLFILLIANCSFLRHFDN